MPPSRSSAMTSNSSSIIGRRQAQRGLVEQQDARARHQAARDGQHLLLAAGQQPGAAVEALAQAREALEQRVDLGRDVAVRRACRRRAGDCRAR